LIQDWLGERRGRKVKIAVPQRAQKADLIELVERNATYELQRAQRGAEQQLLATEDLAQLLDLPHPPRRIPHLEPTD
jgi:excinuclease ABC subunit C